METTASVSAPDPIDDRTTARPAGWTRSTTTGSSSTSTTHDGVDDVPPGVAGVPDRASQVDRGVRRATPAGGPAGRRRGRRDRGAPDHARGGGRHHPAAGPRRAGDDGRRAGGGDAALLRAPRDPGPAAGPAGADPRCCRGAAAGWTARSSASAGRPGTTPSPDGRPPTATVPPPAAPTPPAAPRRWTSAGPSPRPSPPSPTPCRSPATSTPPRSPSPRLVTPHDLVAGTATF